MRAILSPLSRNIHPVATSGDSPGVSPIGHVVAPGVMLLFYRNYKIVYFCFLQA